MDDTHRIVTQRQFLRYLEETAAPVRYVWPGRFQADGQEVRIMLKGQRLGTFVAKLGEVMTYNAYDHLCREILVANMQADKDLPYPAP